MPTIPVWFQARDYFGNKLAAMPYADADNGAQQLMDAFNAAGYTIVGLNSAQLNESAEQLYRHFVDYGNAENVSPNNYFNVDYYIQQKIDQLATTTQTPPYPFTTWTREALDAAMEDAGLSYWDHYAKYGTEEGINPSAQFNTNAYLEAKAAQLNALPEGEKQLLPDGTEGPWTRELVAEALANADLSALEHYYDYGIAEKVDYEPLPEVQPEIYYKAVDLAGLDNPVVGTADNENFVGTVGGANASITPDTQIDGGNGENMLTVTMNGNFSGFKNADALSNIQQVTLDNATKVQHTFNAQNAGDVQIWNLNGKNAPVSISNLAAPGVTVNINDLAGNNTSAIGFAPNANAGTDDTMTIGVKDLGSAAVGDRIAEKDASIRMDGIENVNINATGDNFVKLALVTGMENLTVNGSGNLKAVDAPATINTLDASNATGKLNLDFSNSDDFQSALLGSNDDRLVVSNVNETSTFNGGEGSDKVIINGLSGSYRFNMDDVENMQVNGIAAGDTVTLSGSNTTNLETLTINATDTMLGTELVFGEYNASALTLQTLGKQYQGTAKIADIPEITLNVGTADKTAEIFQGTLDLNAAETVNVNVGGTLGAADSFAGTIVAPNATTLSINMERNSGSFVFNNSGIPNQPKPQLANVGAVEVTGYADVDLSGAAGLGSNSAVLSVDASSLEGNFTASFGTTAKNEDAILTVTGSSLNQNNITVDGDYSSVAVSGGVQADTISINFDRLAPNAVLDIDLGMGKNVVNFTGDWQRVAGTGVSMADFLESAFNGTVTQGNFVSTGASYNPSTGVLTVPADSQVPTAVGSDTIAQTDATDKSKVDLTNLNFAGENNGIVVNGVNGGSATEVVLGETGTDGANINITTNNSSSPATTTVKTTVADQEVTVTAPDKTTDGSAATKGINLDLADLAPSTTVTVNLADVTSSGDPVQDTIKVAPSNASQPGTWSAVHVNDFQLAQSTADAGNGQNLGTISKQGDKLVIEANNVTLPFDALTQYLDNAGIAYDAGSVHAIYGNTSYKADGSAQIHSYHKGQVIGIGFSDGDQANVAFMGNNPSGQGATMVVLNEIATSEIAYQDQYGAWQLNVIGVEMFYGDDVSSTPHS